MIDKPELLFIDLDDTIYPENLGLWPFFAKRIHNYMQEVIGIPDDQVIEIRDRLYETYGSTLRGLQHEYEVDMHDYLAFVHDVDLSSFIKPNPNLREALLRIPQEKWIITNASKAHAKNVLNLANLQDLFVDIIDVVDTYPWCKPQIEAFKIAIDLAGNPKPENCLLVDDRLSNLDAAKSFGLKTLQIDLLSQAKNAHPAIRELAELPSWLEAHFEQD